MQSPVRRFVSGRSGPWNGHCYSFEHDDCKGDGSGVSVSEVPTNVWNISSQGDGLLRITYDRSNGPLRLRLEGRLTGPWVQELERCWVDLPPEQRRGAVVDLAGVTFIGDDGRQLLVKLWKQGALLHATDCLTRSIVENITGLGPNQEWGG